MSHTPFSWPNDFTQRIQSQFQKDAPLFISALQHEPKTSLRLNPHKFTQAVSQQAIAWSKHSYFLDRRPNFALDPLWHAGAYYVQEASSMFLAQAHQFIGGEQPKLILDLCAAPGGKSTQLNSLIAPDDLLVSNELIRSRIPVLHENLTKWGYPNHLISNSDPRQFGELGALFDVLLVDAPCSGEGLFRRDAQAAMEWSTENTKLCALRQQRILADSIRCLKKGGYLIYSTCTFNPAENEEQLQWLSEQFGLVSIRIPLDDSWGVDELQYKNQYAYRFLPHRMAGEGFFISIMQKTEEAAHTSRSKKLKSLFQQTKNYPADWLKITDDKIIFQHKDQIKFAPRGWEMEISYLQQKLNLVKIGQQLGGEIKRRFLPHPELAFSTALQPEAFPRLNLRQEEALQFLAREPFDWHKQGKDWELICFQNIPLGFIKGIGNRCNNYYPKSWRLRTESRTNLTLWYEGEGFLIDS